jgi:hypothetical protein
MRWALLLVPIAFLGCDDTKGPEEDAPADGKLDSFRTPTDHGVIAFGQSQTAKLTADELHHTWSFTLSGPAALHAFTSRVPHKASIDTVLYLYRRTATGWGAYLARNDDDGRADWSSLDRDLAAGEYRQHARLVQPDARLRGRRLRADAILHVRIDVRRHR